MAGGEFRFGTDSIYMDARMHEWRRKYSLKIGITWLHLGGVQGGEVKDSANFGIDGAASNTRTFGNLVHRLACGNLGNSLKASIKSRIPRLSKRLRQTSAISPTECRIGRSGCVHPDTVDSAGHLSQASCDKTPSPAIADNALFPRLFSCISDVYTSQDFWLPTSTV